MGALLELVKVVDDLGTEERGSVLEGRLIDDHRSALGLDTLHHTLNGALAEVVGVGLHGQTVDANHGLVLLVGIPLAVRAVGAGELEHAIGDEVLARGIGLHDGLDEVLRNILIVGKQLLGVLRQAVTAVAEARVVVVGADARIQAYAVDDLAGVEPFGLRVGIELVEVGDAQREVGVGEQLHGLGLGEAHQQRVDVLFDGTLLEQLGERLRGFHEMLIVRIGAHHDTARIQIVVQCLGLTQELRAEDDVLGSGLFTDGLRVTDRNRGLDDHNGIRVDLHHQIDDGLDGGGIEEVLRAVIVGGGRDDYEIGVAVCAFAIQRGDEVQLLLGEVLLDVIVLDRGLAVIDHVDLCRNDVHGSDLMVLGQQRRQAQAHIAGTGNGNLQ